MQEVISRAKELISDGTVNRVIGWQTGEFVYDITPAVFESVEEIEKSFVFDDFCGANMSKYLVKESGKEGKVAVFLKPCDTYSFNQLLKEHRINRENVYVVGVECYGKADIEKIKALGISGITGIKSENGNFIISTIYGDKTVAKYEVMAERCLSCKSKKHVVYDELIGEDGDVIDSDRFDMVVPAKTAYSTTTSQVLPTRLFLTALKKICSISSVLSTLPEDVQTAENVQEFVLSIIRSIS